MYFEMAKSVYLTSNNPGSNNQVQPKHFSSVLALLAIVVLLLAVLSRHNRSLEATQVRRTVL